MRDGLRKHNNNKNNTCIPNVYTKHLYNKNIMDIIIYV